MAIAAAAAALICAGAALFAPWVAPHNPFDLASVSLLNAFSPPVWEEGGNPIYPLGTDDQGRDILSTILYGARISLGVGLASVALALLLGVGVSSLELPVLSSSEQETSTVAINAAAASLVRALVTIVASLSCGSSPSCRGPSVPHHPQGMIRGRHGSAQFGAASSVRSAMRPSLAATFGASRALPVNNWSNVSKLVRTQRMSAASATPSPGRR